jgi:hypothetical protein
MSLTDKYYTTLIQACQKIAADYKSGKACEEVAEGINGFLNYRRIILFRDQQQLRLLSF